MEEYVTSFCIIKKSSPLSQFMYKQKKKQIIKKNRKFITIKHDVVFISVLYSKKKIKETLKKVLCNKFEKFCY